MKVLPEAFDEMVREAVQHFWHTRASAGSGAGQPGNRGSVIGGKNLDGFVALVEQVAVHAGLPASAVITRGRTDLTLPGFFRPTKNWDTLVVHEGHLLAVFEYKSQVGPSFGNNFNNRTEEALGSAADLRAAQEHGAFIPHDIDPSDQVPPFTGYVMVLEDCEASRRPVGIQLRHFPPLPEFVATSYAQRYHLLCQKLMAERLYSGAAVVLTSREAGAQEGASTSLSPETSLRYLMGRFAGEVGAWMDARS